MYQQLQTEVRYKKISNNQRPESINTKLVSPNPYRRNQQLQKCANFSAEGIAKKCKTNQKFHTPETKPNKKQREKINQTDKINKKIG